MLEMIRRALPDGLRAVASARLSNCLTKMLRPNTGPFVSGVALRRHGDLDSAPPPSRRLMQHELLPAMDHPDSLEAANVKPPA